MRSAPAFHVALHQERLGQPPDAVRCSLCPHLCRIRDGRRGLCGVRVNDRGTLYALSYDRVVAHQADPVEKKPLFHVLPGSTTYSVATGGCNLRCAFCQNADISQLPRVSMIRQWAGASPGLVSRALEGEPLSPDALVRLALRSGAASMAYTYTEPTIFFELALDTATLARQHGLRNLFVSNGFTSEAAIRQVAPVLDAVNVDLKAFSDTSYRRVTGARLGPVLDAIRLYAELGVWVEVTTLVIPGLNDSDEELEDIASFLRSVGQDVPWHVSRFFPAWKLTDRGPTPVATLHRALRIGREAGLRYVYAGNVPGVGGECTDCHGCGRRLVERVGNRLVENRIRGGRCPDCGVTIPGVGMDG